MIFDVFLLLSKECSKLVFFSHLSNKWMSFFDKKVFFMFYSIKISKKKHHIEKKNIYLQT